MPMTATLAQVLQEKLGSTGAAEMITWFDDTQREGRQELRELNELNFARFDARVGERMAGLEQRLEQRFGERMASLEQKIEGVRSNGEVNIARLEQKMVAMEARLLNWMIGIWIVTLSAMGVLKVVG